MRLLTDAVKTQLEAAAGTFLIGDATAPADDTRPYAVLYPMDDNLRDGDYQDTQRTAWYEYQITAVGDTREQAEGLADLLRTQMLSADLTPAGFRMHPFEKVVGLITDRDDDVQPPLFYSIFSVQGFVAPV